MEAVKGKRSILISWESQGGAATAGVRDSLGENAFTLIELLVVITIIVILMGLLFPAFRGVQDQAKKTQAKNDLTQIVTAVNAFYTEYGKYPIDTSGGGPPQDKTYSPNNKDLFDVLRNDPMRNPTLVANLNPRQIAFLTPALVKEPSNPRSGIATQATSIGGISVASGDFVDPWGTPYVVGLDGDYSGLVKVGDRAQLQRPYVFARPTFRRAGRCPDRCDLRKLR